MTTIALEPTAQLWHVEESGGGFPRRALAAVAALLAVLTWVAAAVSGWVYVTATDTDRFVATFGPAIEDPTVASAVAARTAEFVATGIDLDGQLAGALPRGLVAATARATEQSVANTVEDFLATPEGRAMWDDALATSQRSAMAVLEGQGTGLVGTGDSGVTVRIGAVVSYATDQMEQVLRQLLGRPVALPEPSPEDLGAFAAAAEAAYGIDLPKDWGTLDVVPAGELARAQQAYEAARLTVWALPLLAVVLTLAAVGAARHRTRVLLWIVALTTGALGAVALLGAAVQDDVAGAFADQTVALAVATAYGSVFDSVLRTGVALAVAAAVVVTGLVLVRPRRKHPYAVQ